MTDEGEDDMSDFVSELEGLVGPNVEVESSYEVRDQRAVRMRLLASSPSRM